MKTLSKENSKQFFSLWIPMLSWTERTYAPVEEPLWDERRKCIDQRSAKKLANYIWKRDLLLDEYLAERQDDLTAGEQAIISDWKRKVSGTFFVERHLSQGSIFISSSDQQVYLVKGLESAWEELLPYQALPVLLDATLLPFRDSIVSDGLVFVNRIAFGQQIRDELKDIYMTAKANKKIIKFI